MSNDEKKTGGQAFPATYPCGSGMTLRDYFAAHAPVTMQDARNAWYGNKDNKGEATFGDVMRTLAALRIIYAEAMIEMRAPKPDFSTPPDEFKDDVKRFIGGPTL